MATQPFDVVVVGTGPGGYVAAIRCAQLGLSVATVEDDRPGGVCLNWGCIPTKALLRNAEVVGLFNRAKEFGITVGEWKADYAQAVQRSRRVADRMAKGVEFLFRKNKITLFLGRGTLKAPRVVEVAGKDGADHARGQAGGHPRHRVRAQVAARRHHRREADRLLHRRGHQREPARLARRHRRGRGGHRVRRRLRGLRRRGHGAGGAAARAAHRGRGGLRADRAALLPARASRSAPA